jgi:putative transcriptional regulator
MAEFRSNRVREFRRRAGRTQAEMSVAGGVSRQTIVSIERGDYSPSVYLALRLAGELDTTVETLFPLDGTGGATGDAVDPAPSSRSSPSSATHRHPPPIPE